MLMATLSLLHCVRFANSNSIFMIYYSQLLITWNIALMEERARGIIIRCIYSGLFIDVTGATYLTGDVLQLISRVLVSS